MDRSALPRRGQDTLVVAASQIDVLREIVAALARVLESGRKQVITVTDESKHNDQIALRCARREIEVVVGRTRVLWDNYRVVFRRQSPAAAVAAKFIAAIESLIAPPSSPAQYCETWGSPFPAADLAKLRKIVPDLPARVAPE